MNKFLSLVRALYRHFKYYLLCDGHEFLTHHRGERIWLECRKCSYTTSGWDLDFTPELTELRTDK